jgi:hypothetical protein
LRKSPGGGNSLIFKNNYEKSKIISKINEIRKFD